jgi:4'-phosphopantetheinyl transferase
LLKQNQLSIATRIKALSKINNRYLNEILWQKPGVPGVVLSESEVHIWRINIRRNLHLLNRFKAPLDPGEIVRAGKYLQQKDQRRFIISRGAQRIILSRYLNKPPAELEFILGDNKKPHVVNTGGNIIHYNLSHSGDWILLAIATSAVGADVEFVDEAFPFTDILPANFSNDEVAYITQNHSAERFFTLWTRKEAILKATGQGLGEYLQITPALDGEHVLPQSIAGGDKNWELKSFNVQPNYAGCVVVEDAGQSFKFFDIDFE